MKRRLSHSYCQCRTGSGYDRDGFHDQATQHILKIVDECFPDQMDKESVFYERFITHLKFFAQRIFTGNEVESDDTEFQEIIRNKYQECLDCVEKIRIYIKNT